MSEITVSEETARTALRELQSLIERTGGSDVDEPCTPIAEGIHQIDEHVHVTGTDEDTAIEILRDVAQRRGVEHRYIDPLTDETFDAVTALKNALAPRPEDVDIDDGDVFQTPNGPVEVVSKAQGDQLEVTDPTATQPQDSRTETWAIAEGEFRKNIVDGDVQRAKVEVNVVDYN